MDKLRHLGSSFDFSARPSTNVPLTPHLDGYLPGNRDGEMSGRSIGLRTAGVPTARAQSPQRSPHSAGADGPPPTGPRTSPGGQSRPRWACRPPPSRPRNGGPPDHPSSSVLSARGGEGGGGRGALGTPGYRAHPGTRVYLGTARAAPKNPCTSTWARHGSPPRPPEAKFGRRKALPDPPRKQLPDYTRITRILHARIVQNPVTVVKSIFYEPRLHADYTRITRTVLLSFDRKFKGFVKGAAVSEAR